MPAGESARSPDGNPADVGHSESGDDGPRKRSASPTASQSAFDNPAKKVCTEKVQMWVQSTSGANGVPDVTDQYQKNHETLANMGFNADEIEPALRMANNEVEKAVQYLTREIAGLDSTSKAEPSASVDVHPKPQFPVPEVQREPFVDSDEEDLAEEDRLTWSEQMMDRIKIILEQKQVFLIFHKNGTLHRRIQIARNILAEPVHANKVDAVNFVDEFVSFLVSRHVNCSDVRPGFDLLRQLLDLQAPYIGNPEAHVAQDFIVAVIPLLCIRLIQTPSSVKTVLAVDEMLNWRNKFFVQGAQYLDIPSHKYPPLRYIDVENMERMEHRRLYAHILDIFVQEFIPLIDAKMSSLTEENLASVTLLDLQCILRSFNIGTNFMIRNDDGFLSKLETWIGKTIERFRIVNDRDIRDPLIRRQGLDLLNEIVVLCDRFGLDVPTTTQIARLDYLQKWIRCSQMESVLHALEELGTIADRFHRTGGMTITRPKAQVCEVYFKRWLEDNKVLQVVLTGNMDLGVYVERIQPILQYMTPELTLDDLKFVWSLRKGRMGVNVENFNKIMELISKSVVNEQINWLVELFKKSFRSRETRLYEPIFNFLSAMAMQKERDDECKLKISGIMWELIYIVRGPPKCGSFKDIEYGMRKHCELMNTMQDKSQRDAFISNTMDAMNSDEGFNEVTVTYLYIALEKLRRQFTPKRAFAGDEAMSKLNELRAHLRERRLYNPILDRLENVRKLAHEQYDSIQNMNTDSQSNAFFETTSDTFGGNRGRNILSTIHYGCTDYAFVLQSSLRLLKWLHDIDASVVDVNYVQRLFRIFIERPDATPQENTEIFGFLFEVKMTLMTPEASRAIVTHICRMNMCSLQITGLRCFCKYWEELPTLSNDNSRYTELFIKDSECKLFIWKLILFNQYDEVVDKCMQTFCERVLVDSPWSLRQHTYSFLSVFSFYVEKLKAELYKRSNKENTLPTYDQSEMKMSDEKIAEYDVPLEDMLTETISRALNRLIRFMTRFVDLGNDKNHMVRENPSHGTSISGHAITYSIELKNEDDDIDCDLIQWKTLICDSSTTVGEFKVRLAKRMNFHEGVTDFSVHKREEDLTMSEANLRYDFLTLQNVKLASETDSIFLSEKIRILIKPSPFRKSSGRKCDLQNSAANQRKALREDFLPMSVISKCNFYDLLHELVSNGDKHIRASIRRLLLLLPTQPSLISRLTTGGMEDDDVSLTKKVKKMYSEYIVPSDPARLLYALETISSIVAPTRLSHQACDRAANLTKAFLEVGIIKRLTDDILSRQYLIPANKCSPADRHAIFERTVQIIRSCLTGCSSFLKMVRNECKVRDEMRRTSEKMEESQAAKSMDPCLNFALIQQPILPPPDIERVNNPLHCTISEVCSSRNVYNRIVDSSLQKWPLDELIVFLESIRNFQWIHVATESLIVNQIDTHSNSRDLSDGQKTTASGLIRSVTKGDRWGDECRLIIVKKVFSLMRHMLRKWLSYHRDLAFPLLDTVFLQSDWLTFYEDVLINSQQEAYRKYGQEHVVKISKDVYDITMASLKMLLGMFASLPLHEGHTADLDDLQRRQRRHSDGLVQTVCEIFYYDSPRRCRNDQKEIDWSLIGYEPIDVVKEQVNNLLQFKPRFSTMNNELHTTETVYAAAKMRMINCLLAYCSQEEIENFAEPFLEAIINDFLFPELPDIEDSMFEEESIRWEYTARESAILTLNTFCERSFKNMYQLLNMWNKFPAAQKPYDPSYRPIVRGRQLDKVGLKNDGGTCYMNATIQQLVHVPGLARELIAIQNIDPTKSWGSTSAALLVELQRVFAQLNFSRCQAVIPYGLWREFRFEADVPLNTKQHHDAIDFYSILLDKCDFALKKLDLPPLFQNRFFGKYSYEKICYGCWHRYKSPDEEFNSVSLALSGDNLEEALENFLAAHVMEGDNAYHCEKCNEKKTTLNRTSFLELPSTMTIQLKRFTYDIVNGMIKKDNQFFKFPFEIDMTPYMTHSRHVPDEHVQDLFDEMLFGNDEPLTTPHQNGNDKPTLTSGSASQPSLELPQKKLFRRHRSSTMRLSQSFANTSGLDDTPQQKPLIYELVGVLAHSGIATAGHYYSFIKERREEYKDHPTYGKWHHINDMMITPMPLNNLEDVWYGGTFTSDGVFVGVDERIRHWNAYVLFYEKKKPDTDMLIPRHIIDRTENVKPKVTFDVSDEFMDDEENNAQLAEEAFNRDAREARKLRIRMFNSLDDTLKTFLNDENTKFLEDRDFFSFDIYYIYVQSMAPLMRREETVEYTVTELSRSDFLKHAFEIIAGYIIRVAWVIFDEHRPKNFPRASTDLIKLLLHAHPENKLCFFKTLEANNSEMLNRMFESTEYDIRNSFWICMKCAVRLWVTENGRKDDVIEISPASSDIDDDEEEDDDEDEEDDELEDEDSETEDLIRHEQMRANPLALVNQLIQQVRPTPPKPIVAVDLSKTRIARVSSTNYNFAKRMISPQFVFQLNMVRKIVNILPFRIHRTEGSGRHYSRHPVELLYMIARLNEFGKSALYLCHALPTVAEFLFEDYATVIEAAQHSLPSVSQVFCRLRFTEDRLKTLGLWPSLPGLYFELLLDTLSRNVQHLAESQSSVRHALLTPAGKFASEVMQLYCTSREEFESTGNKSIRDERVLHNKIVTCYFCQIELLAKSEGADAVKDYIFQFTQSILKKNFTDNHFNVIGTENWGQLMEFFADLAMRLIRSNMAAFAQCLIRNFLWIGVDEPCDPVHDGILPTMEIWRSGEHYKFSKMKEAMFCVRRVTFRELRPLFISFRRRFPFFTILNVEEESTSDEPMDDEEEQDEFTLIGPQPLQRALPSMDLTRQSSAPVATATVTEIEEISVEDLSTENDHPDHMLPAFEKLPLNFLADPQEVAMNEEVPAEDVEMSTPPE